MIKSFFRCGLTGWCIEIIYTAMLSLKKKERTLSGRTSLFMFPIYGLAFLFRPMYYVLKSLHVVFRGIIYMLCIFTGEFCSGSLLRKINCCPWDYSEEKHNIRGLIRLDYAPYWFFTGLLMERVACDKGTHTIKTG